MYLHSNAVIFLQALCRVWSYPDPQQSEKSDPEENSIPDGGNTAL